MNQTTHLIIAGNYRQYTDWLQNHPDIPRNKTKFITKAEDIFEWSAGTDPKIIFTGTWHDRRDASDCEHYAKVIEERKAQNASSQTA